MSKHGKFQTTLEYAVTRALLGGLGLLPRAAAVATGRAAGRLAHKFAGGLRRTGQINLKLAFPELSDAERTAMLRASFDNLGRLLGEFSQFPRATPESLRGLVEYDEVGLSHLRAAEGQGRGVIFLTAHLGAWEFLSFAWSALEYPISFLVRPIDNPRVEELIEGIRTRYGNTAINKKMAARQALRVLRDGGTLGILADLNTHPNEGVFVPFFGHLACTTSGVATLALRTDALVIPTCAVWDEKRGRFFFHGDPPVTLVRTGDDKRDIETNTANFAAAIERMIRAYPEQWLWIHKRWRTRPPGEPDLYDRRTQLDTKESHLTAPTSRNSFS
ncbi:MAG: Kdo2-lipid lauroyltransferase/acyltransferase [Pyrinomonadaceae bacterium]|jgi:KDO2-lipid IV(A) lauroyltransferase|nr:Kdo2-lipid lauroyltransferase/acyltransferase [Pyrinomonadaceae bacterium]